MFATFVVQNEVDQSVYAQEAMDVLYPFLRAAIAGITANCNIPAYVLPYINQSNMVQDAQPAKDNGDLN
jgi:preprotein translocase subunit SecB